MATSQPRVFYSSQFNIKKVVLIGAAFGSLVIVSDMFDAKIAGLIAVSLFTIMLFTTDLGTYLSGVIDRLSSAALRGT